MAAPTPAQRIEQVIRTYIKACNDADAEAIAACFCREAIHYFPWSPKCGDLAFDAAGFAGQRRR